MVLRSRWVLEMFLPQNGMEKVSKSERRHYRDVPPAPIQQGNCEEFQPLALPLWIRSERASLPVGIQL